MDVSQAVEEYRYAILRLSPKTQRWYSEKLIIFASWCAERSITLETLKAADIRRFIDEQSKRINPRTGKPLSTYTTHGYAETIKRFLNWCTREEGIEELVSDKLPKRVDMPRIEQKIIETFTEDQIARLFKACEKEMSIDLEVRDRAILSVLLDTGIRAGELCGLTLDNMFLSPNDSYIKVLGKGRKWRECPLGKEARTAVYRYVTRYRHADQDEQHVFISRKNRPFSVSGLYQLIERLGEWGRVTGVRCCVHDFRHTFATNYVEAGGDVYTLSRLLGHTSVTVTEGYIRSLKQKASRNSGISVLDRSKDKKRHK